MTSLKRTEINCITHAAGAACITHAEDAAALKYAAAAPTALAFGAMVQLHLLQFCTCKSGGRFQAERERKSLPIGRNIKK